MRPLRAADVVRAPAFQTVLMNLIAASPARRGSRPGPRRPGARSARKALRARLVEAAPAGAARRQALRASRCDEQHRVRKRLKRLRYLGEFVAPLFGAGRAAALPGASSSRRRMRSAPTTTPRRPWPPTATHAAQRRRSLVRGRLAGGGPSGQRRAVPQGARQGGRLDAVLEGLKPRPQAQCEWRGTAAPRQPTRKSKSQPSSACSTWSTYRRW